MKKAENAILNAKTPEAYIEASLASRLSPQEKVRLARAWMRATGYSAEDILKARNRHPYWKAKKAEGASERTKKRQEEHDYSGGVELVWTASLIGEFLGMNGKDESGHYQNKDWQMAKRFCTTIPSIQYMRRRLALARRALGSRAGHAEIMEFLGHGKSAAVAKVPTGKVGLEPKPARPLPKTAGKPVPSSRSSVIAPRTDRSGTSKKDSPGAPSRVVAPKTKSAFGVKPVSGRKPQPRPKKDDPESAPQARTTGKTSRKPGDAGKSEQAAARAKTSKPGSAEQKKKGTRNESAAKDPAKRFSAGKTASAKKPSDKGWYRTSRNDPGTRGSAPGSRPGQGKPRKKT